MQAATLIANVSSIGTCPQDLLAVAWLLNLRSDGIPFDPVFHSRLFVDLESAAFCVEETKLTKKLKSHLTSISMSCRVIATISERSCIARMGRSQSKSASTPPSDPVRVCHYLVASQVIIPQISYAICLIWPAFGTRSRHPMSRR
ncbi:hypothetical protein BD311DRAFT_760355 [Dichomitus squalens]|uniref:Uncharacterized protein n=1 Tax=Dichomitus squalens TaxID=114155 RepID=A0A4Q9MJ59_9APHY|nr:hypothetical protein BD311DRAFT_760355 [Dichomitus squalens]